MRQSMDLALDSASNALCRVLYERCVMWLPIRFLYSELPQCCFWFDFQRGKCLVFLWSLSHWLYNPHTLVTALCLRQRHSELEAKHSYLSSALQQPFSGAFAELRKATQNRHVRLSAWKNSALHWTDFNDTLYFIIFRKIVKKIQFSLKSDKNEGYFTWRPIYICQHISLIIC